MEEFAIQSRNGELLLLNYGDDTGLYNYDPEATPVVPVWSVLPSFVTPIPTEVGSVVNVDPGSYGPEGTTIEIEVGSGSDPADFVPYINNGGTIIDAMSGKEMAFRATLRYLGQSTAVVVGSNVTISGVTEPEWPGFTLTPGDDFTAIELRDASAGTSGRRRLTLAPHVAPAPAGSEYRMYSGIAVDGVMADSQTTVLVPGQTRDTNGGLLIGQQCYNHLFIKRLSDGRYDRLHPTEDAIKFEIYGLIIITDPNTNEPPANQVVSSYSALESAMAARIANGSAAKWIVDLESGDYGAPVISDKHLPGEFVIRSKNLALGARFRGGRLNNVINLHFQYCDINMAGMASHEGSLFEAYGVRNVGFSFNRITAPEIIAAETGYLKRVHYGLRIDRSAADRSYDVLIHENEFNGPIGEQLYANGVTGLTVSNNISVNPCGDFCMIGNVKNAILRENWGARLHYPSYDPNARGGKGDFYHSDFFQVWSPGALTDDIMYDGNVFVIAKHPRYPGITRQGFLVQGQTEYFTFRRNIVLTNCYQGIWVENSPLGNHTLEENTVLRVIDLPTNQLGTYYKVEAQSGVAAPGTTFSRNVQQKASGGWTGAFNIGTNGADYSKSLAYYSNPRAEINGEMSSFYDAMQPVVGARTHRDYPGGADGAAERIYDVITLGKHPKKGPAKAAFKAWYDPKGQITA